MTPLGLEDFITLNNCRFRYRIAGENNPETIFLLHGRRGIGDHNGEFTAPSQTELIADLCPNAESWHVPDANHSCHLEKNTLVVAHIRNFLRRAAPC